MYASPNARVTARTPFTRLLSMRPPALAILRPSFSSLPLWSYDSRNARPLRQSTMRASPTFAVYRTRCLDAESLSLFSDDADSRTGSALVMVISEFGCEDGTSLPTSESVFGDSLDSEIDLAAA